MALIVQLELETFHCAICLDLLKYPVTIPCGHSYCMSCIKTHWDYEEERIMLSCPQCRQTFPTRPVLGESIMLAVVMEQLKTGLCEAACVDRRYAGARDVAFDWNPPDDSPSDPEPKTRAEFLSYSQEFTLDPDTANTRLLLSEGNRKVTLKRKVQFYFHNPDRFAENYSQVLSRESLTGRCYWEVEWRGGVYVAVAYKNISRAGDLYESGFGFNDKSWALACHRNGYDFYHNNVKTPVSGPHSCRVGVYLDHSAGVLFFYSVSDTMTLLHRVHATFTGPLYAGFRFYKVGPIAELCKLK